MNETIIQKIEEAPQSPGVYMFKDEEGNVLYVGKAKNLRNRLRSYLSSNVPHKISVMLKKAQELEIITTDTELNAFILENNLIKTHKPPYNVMLKDDKTYPYIKLALKDPFPYLEITRRVEKDGSMYFGPYVPAWAVRETLKTLTQSFPIRRCKRDLTKVKGQRPCLNHQLKKCLAPCSGEVSRDEYMEVVNELISLMEGEGAKIIEKLKREMHQAAENLEFERAAKIRDRIFAIEKILERQKVLLEDKLDLDAVGVATRDDFTAFCVLFIRKGMVVGEKDFVFEESSVEEAFNALLREFYLDSLNNPPLIITDVEVDPSWTKILNIQIEKPTSRHFLDVVYFANTKAKEHLENYLCEKRESEEVLEEAKRMLKLKKAPIRIEGYDISNLFGKEAVGSMVVFEHGRPAKSQYRRFKIRWVEGIDDYGMHREVMRRRISHNEWKRPDLILIDGGLGQLNKIVEVLEEAGWECDVLAISKGDARDHIWSREGEINIPQNHPVYFLLQRVRDESHRFALAYHRKLREKELFETTLDSIDGIGPVRKARILNLLAQTHPQLPKMEDLVQTCGVPPKIAREVARLLEEYYGDKGIRKGHRQQG